MKKKQIKKLKKIFIIGILLFFITLTLIIVNKVNRTKQTTKTEAAPAKIIGGEDVRPGEFPFFAILYSKNNSIFNQKVGDSVEYKLDEFCGGVLVDPNWILTAGHCVRDLSFDNIGIALNTIKTKGIITNKIYSNNFLSATEKFYKFNTRTGEDIGLIKINRPVTNIKPIKMPIAKFDNYLYSILKRPYIFVGFGANAVLLTPGQNINRTFDKDNINYEYFYPVILQKIKFFFHQPAPKYAEYDLVFSVFDPSKTTYNATISVGDSGGPLIYELDGRPNNGLTSNYLLVGIATRSGAGVIDSFPTVQKVIEQIEWINWHIK